ncbi:MAG: twin-arginine translocase TatA/TatE family subunit [Candidatus Thalassarchaeaceae archaeon]|nr:twin-arginine translocase TatA/TatE family subunit [Candidatus Thalassarchaeaceae archaeon]
MPKHLKKGPTERPVSMALGSTEIVILVVFGIFLFGANKIPQLARGVGRAKGEFQMGMKEASEMAAIEDMDRGGMTDEVSSEQE